MERDRRGALRVFHGQNANRATARPLTGLPMDVDDGQLAVGIAPMPAPPSVDDGSDAERINEKFINEKPIIDTDADELGEIETITVVDTTAELLGRAKQRRRSSGLTVTDATPAPAGTRGTRKSSGKKPSGVKRPRTRRSAGNS
jgi:hypothetical protein